jgi:hypothetical protein
MFGHWPILTCRAAPDKASSLPPNLPWCGITLPAYVSGSTGHSESTSSHFQLEPVQRPNTRLSKGICKPGVYTDGTIPLVSLLVSPKL